MAGTARTVSGAIRSTNGCRRTQCRRPCGVNQLAVELLRNAVAAHVDIEVIRGRFAPALFVTVTNVKTGLPRVMSNDAMSIDVLLASACIPELFPAIEIEGEWYWDGGYCGNPTL